MATDSNTMAPLTRILTAPPPAWPSTTASAAARLGVEQVLLHLHGLLEQRAHVEAAGEGVGLAGLVEDVIAVGRVGVGRVNR